jgi:hypothetical protein
MKYNPTKQKNHAIGMTELIRENVDLLRTSLLNRGMETAEGVVEIMKYIQSIETDAIVCEKYIENLADCVLTTPSPSSTLHA